MSRDDGRAPVWTADPLFALLDELRDEGFPIGVGEYLDAQEAAAACHRHGLGHEPHRLRNYLAPVLCTTPEQQEIFYRRFDTWWVKSAGGKKEELPEQPLPPPPLEESKLGEVARTTRPWKWWALSALGAAAVIAALVWWSGRGIEAGDASPAMPGPAIQPETQPASAKQPITSTRTGEVRLAVRLRRLTVNAQVTDLAGRPLPGATVRRHAGGDLIATLKGHTRAINSASFSPDGIRVVTASDDKTARVWSPGKDATWPSIVLKGHQARVNWASFSPDGARIVTASDDKTARVWSRGQDGAWRSVVLTGHRDRVNSASFSPDGARIVTASDDRTVRVWGQGEDGAWHSFGLDGIEGRIISASFSPDGSSILTASPDGWARLWEVNGVEIARLRVDHLSATAFSPDGKHIVLASCDGTTALVWDVETRTSVDLKPYDFCVVAASFSPDSRRVIIASSEAVQIWDAATGEALGEPVPFRFHVLFVALSPNGIRAVTASKGSEARIWSAFPPSNPLTLPILGTSDEKGKIGLSLNQISRTQTLYFSHPGYQSPPPFILPANTVRGALDVKLAPLTLWERLFRHPRRVQAGLVLLPLIFTGPWFAWRVLRRRQLVLERRTTSDQQAVASPSLPEPDHELYRGTGFARARVEVQRRQRTGTGELDPDATIEATVRRVGFFTPVYRARFELPVYLVLVDRIGIRDQRARMVDELLDRLQAGGGALVRYDFDRDPRRAVQRFTGGAHRDLEELAGLHPNHRLAIFTDGSGFFDPATGRLTPWTRLLSAWPERVLLTSVPLCNWGRRELDLAAAGFAVVPASEAGLERLADMLRQEEGAVARPLEGAWQAPYPDLLAARPGRFLERHPPEDRELSALCEELAFYLGPDGYRWLCSLAVYPQLDWYFTLYLGLLLRRFDGGAVLDETTLMALTRLPWLRHGSMPDWLRLRLLRDLSAADERNVRDWMRLFLEQDNIPGSRFRLDVARPAEPEERGLRERLRHWAERMDWRRLIKDLAHGEPREGALRDQIFVSFLLGKKPSRLQVVAPRSWRRWVWEQGLAALGPRTQSVFALTALLSGLGPVLGGPGLEWLTTRFPGEPSTVTAEQLSSLALTVTISFSGDVWLAAEVDGKPKFQQLFTEGESVSIEAQKEVRLTIGYPRAARITVNGYPLNLASSGPVKDLVINSKTVESLARAQGTSGRPPS